jgi:hypothetical protein
MAVSPLTQKAKALQRRGTTIAEVLMALNTVNRRQLVRAAAGVAAGGVLVGGTGVASATADSSSGLVGSWWVTHTTDPPEPPEEGVTIVSFVDGGIAIANDIHPAGQLSTGTWEVRDNHRFRASFWGGFPEVDGNPAGYVRIDVRGRRDGDAVTGTFTVHVFDTSDTEVFTVTGSFEGTRL